MAFNVVHRKDGEKILCNGCKGDRWIFISGNMKTYNKYVCEKCGNQHTLYVDPVKFSQRHI